MRSQKMQISKVLISSCQRNFLPLKPYYIPSINTIRIYHCHTPTGHGIFNKFGIIVTALILIFLFQFSIFSRILLTAIVFYCKFHARGVLWNLISSFWLSIVSQLKPICIIKEIYCQGYPKLHIWFYYPIFLKVP